MMNFILGMGTMWIIISVIFFLLDVYELDLFDHQRASLKWLFLPVYLVAIIVENIPGFVRCFKCLDICIKYKINPFRTSISEMSRKMDTQGKETFISRMPEKERKHWRKALDI